VLLAIIFSTQGQRSVLYLRILIFDFSFVNTGAITVFLIWRNSKESSLQTGSDFRFSLSTSILRGIDF
jgi:hypothetical protein